MKLFYNAGCGQCLLLDEQNGTLLIVSIARSEYIVASGPLEADGSWSWGKYYKDLGEAVEEYSRRTNGR